METSNTTLIKAPVSLVFKTLFDINLATTWVLGLLHYEVISKSENMVGSKYLSLFDLNGLKFEQVSEIIEYTENQSVEWHSTSRFCDGKVSYVLTEISETHTEFKQTSRCQYKGLTKLWVWLVKSKTIKAAKDYNKECHKNFKALVEADYASRNS